jgi:hypothetical protein
LLVANAELTTVREATRELNQMVDPLARGELDKVVLTQRSQITRGARVAGALRRARAEDRCRRGVRSHDLSFKLRPTARWRTASPRDGKYDPIAW